MKQIIGCIKTLSTTDNVILLVVMACVAAMLCFAAQPVERVWCHTDVALTYAIPVLTLIGEVLILIKNKRFTLSRLDIVLITWFLYVMGRAYFDGSYPCATFCLRILQMMMLYVALRLLFTSLPMREKYIVSALILYGLWEAWLGIDQFIHGNSRHYLYLLTGSFLNPGPYSVILAMGLVMTIYWQKTQSWKYLYLPISVFAIILPATWSRAALLATAVCVGIIYWNEWKSWRWWLVASGIVVSLVLYFIKAGSADGRSIIYLISIRNITHHPILGSGIGSFFHQYAEEMVQFSLAHPDFNLQSADVLDYAFNDLFRIGVEQGSIGIIFAIAVIVLTFHALRNKGRVQRMGLLALLIFSLFSYPFELLPYQIIVVLILAYAGTSKPIAICKGWKQQLLHRYVTLSFCLLVTWPVSLFLSNQIEQRAKAESDYRMMAGMTNAAFIDDYYELHPLLTENPRFLFDFGKMLAAQGRYNDSNAMLRQGALISNDPMFCVLQGNNYREMEGYAEAEAVYRKAFQVMPNRLYPIYQLMCLYERTGELQKMRQIAQQVIDFNVKVESPATKEMKDKARQLILGKR